VQEAGLISFEEVMLGQRSHFVPSLPVDQKSLHSKDEVVVTRIRTRFDVSLPVVKMSQTR